MSKDKVRDLLVSRAFGPRNPRMSPGISKSIPSISRRQFLGAGIAAGTLTAMGKMLPDAPRVFLRDKIIVVSYRGLNWEIDPTLFGSSASLAWKRRKETILIKLTGAVFPGTDFAASFMAGLVRNSGKWFIRFRMPDISYEATAPFLEWLSGAVPLRSKVTARPIRFGDAVADLTGNSIELFINSSFHLLFGGADTVVRMHGPTPCKGSELFLCLHASAERSLRNTFLGLTVRAATEFSISEPQDAKAVSLGVNADAGRIVFEPSKMSSCGGESYCLNGINQSVALVEGSGVLGSYAANDSFTSQLRLEHAALLAMSGSNKQEAAIGGRVARVPHLIEVGGTTVAIAGDDSEQLYARFGSGTANNVRVKAKLLTVWPPIKDADIAQIDFSNRTVELLIANAESSAANPPPSIPEADARTSLTTGLSRGASINDHQNGDRPLAASTGQIRLGHRSRLDISLDGATLSLKRGRDLFNLSFTFNGFDLSVERVPVLRRRRPAKDGAAWPNASLTVHFPPQHIAEEWFNVQSPSACSPPSCLPSVARARMSGPSRIAFSVPDGNIAPEWLERPFTIGALTDWTELAMSVNCRALEPETSFERQMEIPGIDSSTGLPEAIRRVAASLQPPTEEETSLELSGRLLLSPAPSAAWITPQSGIVHTDGVLWHARLDDRGRQTVRAIWSKLMLPGKFGACEKTDENMGCPEEGPSLLVLKGTTHWNIVAQSSTYGLIGLRRVPDESKDDVDNPLQTLPRGSVVRPDVRYCSLVEMDALKGFNMQDSGFAIPTPFADANIVMTPMGGSITANWYGEPPTLLRAPEITNIPWPDLVSLEMLGIRTQLSRDIQVKAVSKGYLLPLGNRASYVEIAERVFFPHPIYRYPVAYEVQRTYIVVQKPEKRLPGINQAFASRDFPAERIGLLTKTTPDLVNPTKDPNSPNCVYQGVTQVRSDGRVLVDGLPDSVLIFWPRTRRGEPGTPGDVDFKWTVDNDETPLVSNLLFVGSGCIALDRQMGLVADYYRTLTAKEGGWSPLRIAQSSGARRRYAQTASDGTTTFDTDSWLLSTRGRILPGSENSDTEVFQMDGRMEGADQPPFYPVLDSARISIQTLDRLLGSPQGLIEVAYNPTYVRHGFDSPHNRSEIYLNVLGPDIKLDVSAQGDSTGALAKPNTLVAALSPKQGLIGGTKNTLASAAFPPAKTVMGSIQVLDTRRESRAILPTSRTSRAPYNFQSAQDGKFDPKEFLGGIANTKLLGLIDLKDILKSGLDISAAPQLQEKLGYGALGAQTEAAALGRIKETATAVGKPLSSTLTDLRGAIKKAFDSGQTHVTFAQLYPQLDANLAAVELSLKNGLDEIEKARSIVDIADPVNAIVVSAKVLLAEIERTLHEPVPQLVQLKIAELAQAWNALKDLANINYREFGRTLLKETVGSAILTFCAAVDQNELGEVLFGTGPDVDCRYIVENPVDALDRSQHALFTQVFTEPLADVLIYLRSFEAEVTAKIAWARRSVASATLAQVAKAANALRARLQPIRPNETRNVLVRETQESLTREFLDVFTKIVDNASASGADAADTDTVLRVLGEIETAIARSALAIDAVIDNQRSIFKPLVASDHEAIIQDFKRQTVASITAAAQAAVNAEVARVRGLLLSKVQETRAAAIERLFEAAERIVTGMGTAVLFAQVAKAARSVVGWCGATADPTTARVIALADDLTSGLLGSSGLMIANITEILQNARQINLPNGTPSDILAKFERARSSITAAAQQLALTVQNIDTLRAKLADVRKAVEGGTLPAACDHPATFLRPATQLMQLRQEAVSRLHDLASQAAVFQSLLDQSAIIINRSSAGQFRITRPLEVQALATGTAGLPAALDGIVRAIGALLLSVTSAGRAGLHGKWDDVTLSLDMFRQDSHLKDVSGYVAKLEAETDQLERLAGELRKGLTAASLNSAVLLKMTADVATYALENDKRLAALALQSVALTQNLSDLLGKKTAIALSTMAARFATLHEDGSRYLKVLLGTLNDPVVLLVVNPKVVALFAAAKDEVDTDLRYLRVIEAAQNDVSATLDAALKLLNERWRVQPQSSPALVQALTALANLVETFLRGDLASLINLPDVPQLLATLKDQLTSLVTQLLPTRADLTYSWSTGLNEMLGFSMTDGWSPNDLTIDARVSVDFVTGLRSASVMGKLKPFTINLLKPLELDIAQIKFKDATFLSRNGAAPEFNARVNEVVLGQLLQFLQPLQAWMSPSEGDGFYVKPVLSPSPGIEAGYIYDAGVIQLGTLQFINVALGVAARLPFADGAAELEFRFASIDRPFLIAAPPYGGGGYLKLVSSAGDITEFGLSFVFGGVVAIKFGPLRGTGRIVSGVTIDRTKNSCQITALVEAVGEGNIACFAICVSIQVGLRSESEGRLFGYSNYSFSFKVGFVTFKYGFRAEYTIQSGREGSGNEAATLALVKQAPNDIRTLTNLTPRKGREWRTYRERVSMTLLKE